MITWIHTYRPRSDWYHQTQRTRDRLRADWEAAASESIETGATRTGPLSIRGQSRQERLEIWAFRDLEQLEKHWTQLRRLAYTDWLESENTVATEVIESRLTGPGT